MPSRAEERAPRESEARTPDTGASDQFSGVTAEPDRRDELGRASSDGPDGVNGVNGVNVVMEEQSGPPEGREPDMLAETTDPPATRREEDPPRDDSWDWADENIVPEGLRSQR